VSPARRRHDARYPPGRVVRVAPEELTVGRDAVNYDEAGRVRPLPAWWFLLMGKPVPADAPRSAPPAGFAAAMARIHGTTFDPARIRIPAVDIRIPGLPDACSDPGGPDQMGTDGPAWSWPAPPGPSAYCPDGCGYRLGTIGHLNAAHRRRPRRVIA
jgi:hypothetical protein